MLILQEKSPDYFCHKEKFITCHKWDGGDKHRSSFIIEAIPLIARGQLVWVEGKEDMTISWHPIQFVIRYAQVAYCGYTLIDASDPKICAALRMENYFQTCLLDLCLTKLPGRKGSTSIRADPEYPGVRNFAGSWCVLRVQTLEAAWCRAATEARLKKRERFFGGFFFFFCGAHEKLMCFIKEYTLGIDWNHFVSESNLCHPQKVWKHTRVRMARFNWSQKC